MPVYEACKDSSCGIATPKKHTDKKEYYGCSDPAKCKGNKCVCQVLVRRTVTAKSGIFTVVTTDDVANFTPYAGNTTGTLSVADWTKEHGKGGKYEDKDGTTFEVLCECLTHS